MLKRFMSLFVPSIPNCPLCGRRRVYANQAPIPIAHKIPRRILRTLCSYCLELIPWISYVFCHICGRPTPCEDCLRPDPVFYDFCRSAVSYSAEMKNWLALYKYRGNERIEPILAAMLAFAFERILAQRQLTSDVTLTSVPLSQERLEQRGFNQSERLASYISNWYKVPFMPTLYRLHHAEKQSLKSRFHRIEDMKNNFILIEGIWPRRSFLLVDDIYTTGSTLNECARVLRLNNGDAEKKICGLLWARA